VRIPRVSLRGRRRRVHQEGNRAGRQHPGRRRVLAPIQYGYLHLRRVLHRASQPPRVGRLEPSAQRRRHPNARRGLPADGHDPGAEGRNPHTVRGRNRQDDSHRRRRAKRHDRGPGGGPGGLPGRAGREGTAIGRLAEELRQAVSQKTALPGSRTGRSEGTRPRDRAGRSDQDLSRGEDRVHQRPARPVRRIDPNQREYRTTPRRGHHSSHRLEAL